MPPRDPRALLADIVQACDRILDATAGMSAKEYAEDWKVRSIAERQFITIGEAVAALIRLDVSMAARITESRRIVDFRNILVHGYNLIEDTTVWGVIDTDAPRLRDEARRLLDALDSA